MAVNCCVVPFAIDELDGVTAIDTSTAGPTVSVVLPLTAPELALTWEVPSPTPLAMPPAVIVATVALADTQETALVSCWVLPSL